MKKYLTILLIIFSLHLAESQSIDIKDDIAYVDDKPYLKIKKKSNKLLFLYDVHTNEKLLKVTIQGKYNRRDKKDEYTTRFYFVPIKKRLKLEGLVLNNEKLLIQFLYDEQLFVSNKAMTTEEITAGYKHLLAEAKCNNVEKNEFIDFVYDDFISIINKDTISFKEVKYRCVQSSFYIQKVMYDRFGKWNKAVLPSDHTNRPNLIWNNVQLFDDVAEKFTVIARGYEGSETSYTSMIILDSKGKDMLAENAPYQFRFVELFGYFIKKNSSNRDFYEVYWKTFNPARWRELESYRQSTKPTKQE